MRALIQWLPYILPVPYALYQLAERHEAPEDFEGRRLQVVAHRGVTDDVVINTYDFVNFTGGAIDTTWIDTDYEGVEARIRDFLLNISPNIASNVVYDSFRWSVLPGSPGVSDPAVRVMPISPVVTGGSAGHAAPQLASTVTKVVPLRKHWGRVFLGPLGTGAFDTTTGRVHANFVNQSALAFEALRVGLEDDETPMVVFNRSQGLAMTVEGTRVDDIPDVIRSRRFHLATLRNVLPAPPP